MWLIRYPTADGHFAAMVTRRQDMVELVEIIRAQNKAVEIEYVPKMEGVNSEPGDEGERPFSRGSVLVAQHLRRGIHEH